jgi:hypothetical protein
MNRLRKSYLPFMLVVLLALMPRTVAVGGFLTADEAYHWIGRVEDFARFIDEGAFAETNIIGHPGVTTMWLGGVASRVHYGLVELGWLPHPDADQVRYWNSLRFPIGLITVLSVVAGYALLRRLVGERVAFVAAILWATEPFLIAHSKLLHLDALVTSFIALSMFSAMVALPLSSSSSVRWRYLIASAVAGGLALLTKSPSIIIMPMVGLIALVHTAALSTYPSPSSSSLPAFSLRRHIGHYLLIIGVWGTIAAGVWVALWPAAWVDLPGAIGRVIKQVAYEGGSPHGWGNFFLGRAVDDPGMLFYPVVLAIRMTPWMMIGLFAASLPAIAAIRRRRAREVEVGRAENRFPCPRCVGMIALFALLFIIMMTIPPKKFDRYLLPIFPFVAVISAIGWVYTAERVHTWLTTRSRWRDRPLQTWYRYGGAVAGVALVGHMVWFHPYELAYYNQLLGGGKTAVHTLPVGWGEGYEQAGAFISAQPNGCDRAVASWFAPVLSRFLCNHWVVSLDRVFEPGKVDYAVLYIDQMQRENKPRATHFLLENFARIHTVKIHGIDYAYVYQLPLPNAHRIFADFGSSMRLLGYDIETNAVRESGILTVTLQWKPRTPITEDYMMFLHVFDGDGERVGQIDVPPAGPRAPTSGWNINGYATWIHPIPVPPDLPPGNYWIAVGVYHPEDFSRLPVDAPRPAGAPDDGPHTLFLDPFRIE